jgi:chloride channel 3/4/5
VSFKRKPKESSGFSISRFLSSPANDSVQPQSFRTSPRRRTHHIHSQSIHNDSTDAILPYLDSSGTAALDDMTKTANGPDWYVEGPGRRVGYDNLTAIDWIFEYAKERQRLRVLRSSATGILGYIREFADASQVWLVLIGTGIAAGLIAAFIDVASGWLGDIKTGHCRNFTGGKFYLSKAFCCWGHDELSKCLDWNTWSHAFGITAKGGSYIIDYVSFVLFSVLPPSKSWRRHADSTDIVCRLCQFPRWILCTIRQAQRYT